MAMNKGMFVLPAAALLLAGAAAGTHAAAATSTEIRQCEAQDRACFEQNHVSACMARTATVESCTRWVEVLKPLASRNDRLALSMLGMADAARAERSTIPAEQKSARAEAVSAYKQLLALDPSDAQAMLSLAVATDDHAERISLLRKGTTLAPKEIYALQLLAAELQRAGGKQNLTEAAESYEKAYAVQTNMNKWHLAAMAIALYEQADAPAQATTLRERARQAIDADGLLVDLDPSRLVSAEQASATLAKLCYPAVIALDASGCLRGVDLVFESAKATPSGAGALADVTAAAMVNAAEADLALSENRKNWRESFTGMLDVFLAQKKASVPVLNAYASLTPAADKRLDMYEQAARLAPSDIAVAGRLGVEYLSRGRWDDALRQFERGQSLATNTAGASAELQSQFAGYMKAARDGIAREASIRQKAN
jgi:tetratricopeptide (TPR) repeat protein